VAPLLGGGYVSPHDIVAVAASGTSGAGRKAAVSLSATEVMGSMTAYKVGGVHQHTAEVIQEQTAIAGQPVTLSFTPMLAPMPRGILATTTMRLSEGSTGNDVCESIRDYYADSRFVHVLPEGSWPTTAATAATNCAQLQVAVDERAGRAVVVCAIDNLGKGAAGQAIQNANLMCGFDESTGLNMLGVAP
jgi:N-acetyl-gamma-glutamyl-phosphate reductase